MKPAGFLCKIDKLGRIVIPKPLRNQFNLNTDDTIELFTEPDSIIIKKYAMSCTFCGNNDGLSIFKGQPVCRNCREQLAKTD